MAVQIRERLTITADGIRTHGEYFRVRKARSLPRFLTATPVIEMKPRLVNKKKKKHDQKERRQERQKDKKIQKQNIRSTRKPL